MLLGLYCSLFTLSVQPLAAYDGNDEGFANNWRGTLNECAENIHYIAITASIGRQAVMDFSSSSMFSGIAMRVTFDLFSIALHNTHTTVKFGADCLKFTTAVPGSEGDESVKIGW